MYKPYQCSSSVFEEYYTQQAGNGLSYYRGVPLQKGAGLGGVFKSFYRMILPLFRSGAKAVGKQALRSGIDIANDVLQGKEIKASAKERAKEASKLLTGKAADKAKTMIGVIKGNVRPKNISFLKSIAKCVQLIFLVPPNMALIRHDSPHAVKSELDIFLTPSTETSLEKGHWVEYHPISNIRDGNPIEFNLSGSGEDYIDLSATQLYVKVRILKDKKELPEKEKMAPTSIHILYSHKWM